jgi:hypothetical protein
MPRSRNRRRKRTRRKKGGQDKPLKKLGAHCSRHMFTHGECDEGLTCYKNMCVHEQRQDYNKEKKCLEVRDMTKQIAKNLYDGKVLLDGFSKPYEMEKSYWRQIDEYPHCDYRRKKEDAVEPAGYYKVWEDREGKKAMKKKAKQDKINAKIIAAREKADKKPSHGIYATTAHGTFATGGKTRRRKRTKKKRRRKRSKKKKRRRRRKSRK